MTNFTASLYENKLARLKEQLDKEINARQQAEQERDHVSWLLSECEIACDIAEQQVTVLRAALIHAHEAFVGVRKNPEVVRYSDFSRIISVIDAALAGSHVMDKKND